MTSLSEQIRGSLLGGQPIKRENRKAGQTQYYYINPGQEYATASDLQTTDIPDEMMNPDGTMKTAGQLNNVQKYNQEVLNSINQQQSPWQQVTGAITDMSRNYFDMKQDNTVGADDYFHCKANYEAANRGPWGAATAQFIGDAKEATDYWDNQLRKGLSSTQAALDRLHDREINKIGRQSAQTGLYSNSREACNIYRVKGINDKY